MTALMSITTSSRGICIPSAQLDGMHYEGQGPTGYQAPDRGHAADPTGAQVYCPDFGYRASAFVVQGVIRFRVDSIGILPRLLSVLLGTAA